MTVTGQALEFLDALEREEISVLSWGLLDGYFTEDELEARADAALSLASASGGACEYDSGWDIVEALIDEALLWRIPGTEHYRTRMAEIVRLLASLRQVFPDVQNRAWRTAPGLVADYRVLRKPRLYPRRDLDVAAVHAELPAMAGIQRSVLDALLRAGTQQERRLARFQSRSAARILRLAGAERAYGTVVCAGTGSGKTLAFYLPAYMAIASTLTNEHWTRCLAIYPRNELLKDQLREALANAQRIAPTLRESGRRSLVVGALYGDVPNRAQDVLRGRDDRGWERVSLGGARARVCPFVRCPSCNASMVWLEADVEVGTERLRCLAEGCGAMVGESEIRLTRERALASPPDVLFTSTEMLNQRLSSKRFAQLLGIGRPRDRRPAFVLLDEVHSYDDVHGAHVALLLRRWRAASNARPHYVGLSATLADAPRFFAELVGIGPGDVAEISPQAEELEARGAEYLLALRGDASSGTSLLSTTLQTAMLLRRGLSAQPENPFYGSKVFAFTDNLDVINRLYHSLLDAEGWDPFGRPNPRRAGGSLANLRASALPSAQERLNEGQNWELAERIGHVLAPGERARVGRTSSQDRDVDPNAEIIVATTALEVGFDDPEVGAVLQHKAPKSAAAFLQRKGRAGRRQAMRPWTVVALSDYGRDRAAYQGYEQLFSPNLPPRHLPLGNRAVLRIQATFALFDWLAARLTPSESPEPWTDFSTPAAAGSRAARRQASYADSLRALLRDEAARADFSRFVERSLAVDAATASALLWQPPRAVIMEAVPTLLRRLERAWQVVGGDGTEHHVPWVPLPEFVPRTLFSDLQLPELDVRIPALGRIAARVESMPLAQGLREFAAGRVSRRFGTTHAGEKHWVEPGDGQSVLIDGFCSPDDRQELGSFAYALPDDQVEHVTVFRPHAIDVAVAPADVQQSSNSFLAWKTQLVPTGGGHRVDAPLGTRWEPTIGQVAFHTHHLGLPLEVRRFALGARASVGRGPGPQAQLDLAFACSDAAGNTMPAAIGFVADVDAVQIRFRYPRHLYRLCAEHELLLRGLRPARFRALVQAAPALDGIANQFQRDWIANAYLSAITLHALTEGTDLAMAEEAVRTGVSGVSVSEVMSTLLQWSDEVPADDGGGGEGARGRPRRLDEMDAVLQHRNCRDVLQGASAALWEPPSEEWEAWLRRRFKATLGGVVLSAAQAACPQMDDSALVVDLDAFTELREGDEDEFWLTETTVGGGGFVEQLLTEFASDPRRFFRLLDAALEPSELEYVGDELGRLLSMVVSGDAAHDRLVQAVASVRAASSHRTAAESLSSLRAALAAVGVQPTPTFMVSANARLLRPGTSPRTDAFVAGLIADWDEAERSLGVDVDARVFALVKSDDEQLEEALEVEPQGATAPARSAWRYSVLYGMLWPRGAQVRAETLRTNNPFERAPECDRLLVAAALQRETSSVSIARADWFDELARVLVREGVAELTGELEQSAELASALLRLAADPVDSEALLVHARIVGVSRSGREVRIEVELPEAHQ